MDARRSDGCTRPAVRIVVRAGSDQGDAPKIDELGIDERLKLVEDIWDSIVAEQDALPLTPAQRDELDRRLARYRIDRDRGTPAELAIERIRTRLHR